jgi:hypothetical protein
MMDTASCLKEKGMPQGDLFPMIRIMFVMVTVVSFAMLKQWQSELMQLEMFR